MPSTTHTPELGSSKCSCLVVQAVHCPKVPGAWEVKSALKRRASRKDRQPYLEFTERCHAGMGTPEVEARHNRFCILFISSRGPVMKTGKEREEQTDDAEGWEALQGTVPRHNVLQYQCLLMPVETWIEQENIQEASEMWKWSICRTDNKTHRKRKSMVGTILTCSCLIN